MTGIDIGLARGAHPDPTVLITGVGALDVYVEACWGPRVGATAVALVRLVHRLAGPVGGGPRAIACDQLALMLGVPASQRPTPNNRIGNRMLRVQGYRLAECDLDRGRFTLYDPLPLVPAEVADELPMLAWRTHHGILRRVVQRLADPSHRNAAKDADVRVTAHWALDQWRQLQRLDATWRGEQSPAERDPHAPAIALEEQANAP